MSLLVLEQVRAAIGVENITDPQRMLALHPVSLLHSMPIFLQFFKYSTLYSSPSVEKWFVTLMGVQPTFPLVVCFTTGFKIQQSQHHQDVLVDQLLPPDY